MSGGEENSDQRPTKRRKLKLSLSKYDGKGSESPGNANSVINGEARDDEAYFSANFKSICRTVLSESSPEKHVFTDHEVYLVKLFTDMPSKYNPVRMPVRSM